MLDKDAAQVMVPKGSVILQQWFSKEIRLP